MSMSAGTASAGFKPFVARVASGVPLSAPEAEASFGALLDGGATPAQIGAFLMALRMRGETVDEIKGAVSAMRNRMVPVIAPADAIDIVGTGGDHSGSYNVSTLAAIITAACGVPVAKHGNSAASSLSGSADVLSELGVKIGLSAEGIAACLKQANIAFMMAKAHHPAMRHVGPVRMEMGTRTIFNLLGPLSNPAQVKRLLLGVFDKSWMRPMAEVLQALGAERVLVVHGADGLDELTTTTKTHCVELKNGSITAFDIDPAEAGLPLAQPEDLKGGNPAHNAAALRGVLGGQPGAYRDVALLNAGAALMIADKAKTLREGVAMAASAVDSGRAAKTLELLAKASQDAS
jgi:anthranilate phosphoribosyltransferase